ncbi:RHS repeat-associated core domain-containing protein [Parachlamydia sp. AcF125]|uniref:RHS repeat-associated core domain-containing protein n=1 Tax=Parachlamydia sp. AcF125 TaxID=2795736 RepID=UPI001BC9C48D|nr:RHS repeat-associated core domain-containing protein [Parachlamydia sp. AcF125]MBS4167723.1 tRNA(Glu)-specific nuclease WapA [Parachlamydia sp. AcF125]
MKNIYLFLFLIFCFPLFSFQSSLSDPESLSHLYLHHAINVITGTLHESETDLTTLGPQPLVLSRIYYPQERAMNPWEHGWQFNYPPYQNLLRDKPCEDLLEYDSQGRLIKICKKGCTNGCEKPWISFKYSEDNPLQCEVKSHDGQNLKYSYAPYVNSKNQLCHLLEEVKLPSGAVWKYRYQDHPLENKILLTRKEGPQGYFIQTEYYDQEEILTTPSKEGPLRNFSCGKIKRQWQPSGADKTPEQTLHLFYSPGKTEVFDALNNKTVYHYNAYGQITSIESYLKDPFCDPILYRKEKYYWDPTLKVNAPLGKAIEDSQGNVWLCQRFYYNDSGSLIQETLYGNLTGHSPLPIILDEGGIPKDPSLEHYSSYYEYEGKNLSQIRSDNGSSVCFVYENQWLKGKFYREHERIRIREFYEYNADGVLIKTITDDGCSFDLNDLDHVSERQITYTHLFQTGPFAGLPSVIEEKSFHLSDQTEHLLKRIQHFYSPNHKLIRRDIFDGQQNFSYSEMQDYDRFGNLTYLSTPTCTQEYKFDIYGNMLFNKKTWTSGESEEILQEYDYRNRLIRQEIFSSSSSSKLALFSYDSQGNKIAEDDGYGNTTTLVYDGLNRLVQTISPAVHNERGEKVHPTLAYTYNLFDQIASITNPKGETTHTTYNIRGKPIKIEYPDHSEEAFEYALDGSLKKWHMKNGCSIEYERDFLGRVTQATLLDSLGSPLHSTQATYSTSHLKTVRTPPGIVVDYLHSPSGKQIGQIQHVDGSSLHTVHHYNMHDQLLSTEEWVGPDKELYTKTAYYQTGSLIESQQGKVLQEIKSKPSAAQLKHEKRWTNTLGQNVLFCEEIDKNQNLTTSFYDALGRIVSIVKTNREGELLFSQEIRYDLAGNKAWQKSQNGKNTLIHEWEYAPGNHLIKHIEGSGLACERVTYHLYDKDRRVKTIKPNGVELMTVYNSRGLVEHFFSSDGTIDYSYVYDTIGRLLQIKDHCLQQMTTREYSPLGFLIHEELGHGFQISHQYDAKGRKTQVTLPDHSEIRYHYDPLFLKKIQRISPEGRICYQHTYTYDIQGQLETSELIQGLGKIHYRYGPNGDCKEIHSPYFKETLLYDSRGNLKNCTTTCPHANFNADYSYDCLGQLIQEQSSHFEHSYLFDSLYQRVKKDQVTYSYDDLFQLLKGADESFEYDQNGNCTAHTLDNQRVSYTYDALDRLIRVDLGQQQQIHYHYDCFNRRLSKSVKVFDPSKNGWYPDKQSFFLYDEDREIGEIDKEGNIQKLRILGLGIGAEIGAAIAMEIQGNVYAPICDHRGSISCLVDAKTAEVIESYCYSAFGEELIYNELGEQVAYSPANNPWRFSSKYRDEETQLLFFGRRFYDPRNGRWLTPDPLRADSPNFYTYVNNHPLSQVDLYGLFSVKSAYQAFSDFTQQLALPFGSSSLKQCLKKCVENLIVRPFFHLTDFHICPSLAGIYGQRENSDRVRVTMINGILNTFEDFSVTLQMFSETHGGENIHYVFRPTQGLFSDLLQAFMSKIGYASPHVRQLANTWKEMIQEMGGTESGGLVIHYAHSLGGTDTYTATQLLTPEEKRMLRIFTLGSPSLFSSHGFESVFNYVSKRDGISLFDPVGYFSGILSQTSNVTYIGSFRGVPLIDHWIASVTYTELLKLLGVKFLQCYPYIDQI